MKLNRKVISLVLFSLVALSFSDLSNGLIAYYPFNGNANDESGNGNNGIVYGATLVQDKDGNENSAYTFDGQNDYIRAHDLGDVTQFTVAFWRKCDGPGPGYIPRMVTASKLEYYYGSDDGFVLEHNPDYQQNRIGIWISPDGENKEVVGNYPIDYGTWNFLVLVFNGTTGIFYLDNEIKATMDFTPGKTLTFNFLEIGGNSAINRYFKGILDDICIYNRALSASEIQDLYELATTPTISCAGFLPPLENRAVAVKKNRVLPLKTELFYEDDFEITDQDIAALPVLQILYHASSNVEPIDVTDEALPAGEGTDGNQFVYTVDGLWQFNMKTRNYSSPGTYTINIVSGDDSEYSIDQSYTAGTFVIK
jgi:hypothetical protein